MNEKGSIIAEIGDCARDEISYAQLGSESAVIFEVFFSEIRYSLGSMEQQIVLIRKDSTSVQSDLD